MELKDRNGDASGHDVEDILNSSLIPKQALDAFLHNPRQPHYLSTRSHELNKEIIWSSNPLYGRFLTSDLHLETRNLIL
jgi:hypothetical protein